MAVSIFHDSQHKRAVLYCTTTERALNHEAFIGDDAQDQAQDFLDWLDIDPRDTDALAAQGYKDGPLNGVWYPALDHAESAWHRLAFDSDTDEFVGARGRVL